MANQDFIESLSSLLQELQQITIASMAETGVKPTSDLSKSVKWVVTKDGLKMMVAEYYPFVDEGRSTTKRRAMMHRIPLSVLIEWIKRNNIKPYGGKTTNELAWAIQTAIYKRGLNSKRKVKGKNYGDKVANNVADYTANELADTLATQIADELVDMFAPIAA